MLSIFFIILPFINTHTVQATSAKSRHVVATVAPSSTPQNHRYTNELQLDDLKFTPPTPQPVGVYNGLSWPGFIVGSSAVNVGGVLPNTPPDLAASSVFTSSNLLQPMGSISVNSTNSKSFTLDKLCFACVETTRGVLPPAPLKCTIKATAYGDVDGKVLAGSQALVYDPKIKVLDDGKTLTANMTCFAITSNNFDHAKRVDFAIAQPPPLGSVVFSGLLDTVGYDLFLKG